MRGAEDSWLDELNRPALRSLTGCSEDLILVLDQDAKICFINRDAQGLAVEHVLGTLVFEHVPEDQRPAVYSCLEHVKATGKPGQYETTYAPPNGASTQFWEWRVSPIFEQSPEPGDDPSEHSGAANQKPSANPQPVTGFLVVSADVTERREAAAQRDRSFALSLDLFCVASLDGYFQRVNPAFTKLLGFSSKELLSRPFEEFIHPEDREITSNALKTLAGGKDILDFENRYATRDGKYRTLSWRATVDRASRSIVAVARDVTDRKALESQLRQSQKMEAVGQLAGGLAHDFNNLLLSIMVNAEFATSLVDEGEDLREHLEEIDRAAQRASDLVKQLLAFSRSKPAREVAFDINDLTRGLLKMLRRLIPENIELDFVPAFGVPTVQGDPSQIEQVMLNLCLNARDAMPEGGRLTLETENVIINGRFRETHPWARPGRYVLISVSDTGSGMTPEVRERIFEPFFTTKEAGKGTGLGLATAYAIVEQHRGLLHVYTELGRGSAFKVYLPAASVLAADVGDKIDPGLPGGRETILIAEDEEQVRTAVMHILERAGYRVITTANGVEALRELEAHGDQVALVLLDVVMPEMSGPDTYARIRERWPRVKVLLSSGYTDHSRFTGSLPADVPLLEKPYRTEGLLNQIHQLLAHDPQE